LFPFTLLSLFLLSFPFHPFFLAADLAVKLPVDGRWLRADLRVDRARFGPSGWLAGCSTARCWCARSTPANSKGSANSKGANSKGSGIYSY
jgi:hypothetical protein